MTVALPMYVNKRATILAGESESDVIDSEGFRAVGVCMPDLWTAADLSFLVSATGADPWLPLYELDGTEVKVDTPSADQAYTMPGTIAPWRYFKIRSGNAAADVDQLADRVFELALMRE